jgi:hypothetical protein
MPTNNPIKKLPKIINTLDIDSFQNKNFTSIISEFCREKITTNTIKNKTISALNFMFLDLLFF